MKTIIRSHRIAALLSLLLLIATIVALLIFVHTIHAREQRVLDARDRLASYELNKRTLTEENTKLDAIRARVATLQQHIITEDTTPPLLSSLESMAKQNGIAFTLTAVTATTTTPKTPGKLHIDFSADGSFAGIQQFVATLLAQPYEVQLTRLSLYATDGTTPQSKGAWQLLAGVDILSF